MPMIETLIETRDSAQLEYENYVTPLFRENRELTDDEETRVADLKGAVERANARVLQIEEDIERDKVVQEARTRLGTASVDATITNIKEPRTYGPGTGNSWFADVARVQNPGMFSGSVDGARSRMDQYAREVAGEMRDPNSAEGKRAAKQLLELGRPGSKSLQDVHAAVERAMHFGEQGVETRAGMSTGSTSGGSFVTPQYFVSDYAPYRQFNRVFADAANKMPLPDYGMTIYVPAVNTAAGVAAQAGENQGITEQDPNAGYLSTSLTTNAGQVTVSQQLLDRAGPDFQFDKMIFDQLNRAYDSTLDTYVITQALANAGSGASISTPGWQSGGSAAGYLYSKLGQAKALCVDAAGVVLPATHAFFQPINWEWYASQVDVEGRLQITPNAHGPWNAVGAGSDGTPIADGDTGYIVNGLHVMEDGNIPATGGTNQVVVAHMPEVWFWEGDLVMRTVPQTAAQNLSVLLQAYAYVGCIVRYPKAVQTITGAGVPSSPTF